MSLFDSFSPEQKAALDSFTQAVSSAQILDDIYKLIITRQVFTRILAASDFDEGVAVQAMRDYIAWRRRFQVDMLLDHDFMGKEDVIREFMPMGFHEVDKAGRPMLFINAGQIKLNELLQQTSPETVTKYIIRELEHTWREKIEGQVDQIRIVVDLKGATLKQIANKQLNLIWKEICKELSKRFPEIVHSITVVNTPMFFENLYSNQIEAHFSERTRAKVHITGESEPQCLLEAVDAERLPAIYGGTCNCSAQCIYSDKGPWTNILNVIDFQNRQYTTTEAEFVENIQAREEFKMLDGSDDEQEDLLGDGAAGMSDLQKLKQAFSKHLPASSIGQAAYQQEGAQEEGLRQQMQELGIGTAHNTLANEEEDNTTGASSNQEDQQRQIQLAQLNAMLHGKMKVVSGATPMHTHEQEEPAKGR